MYIWHLLTYFGLLPHEEHRPSTTLHQGNWLWVVFSSTDCFYAFLPQQPVTSVPSTSPLSLPLWIPGQSLPGDVAAGWRTEGVANPTPLSSMNLCGHWFLVCCPAQALTAYLVWPLDTEDFAQIAVNKSLELMECWQSHSPSFWSTEEYWLHISDKIPWLGGFSNLSGAPSFLENQGGTTHTWAACSDYIWKQHAPTAGKPHGELVQATLADNLQMWVRFPRLMGWHDV